MNELYRIPSEDPARRIYRHPSGMVMHTIVDRVEAFKELISRANRIGGSWWLITDGEVFIARAVGRGCFEGWWPVAKVTSYLTRPTRVELITQPKEK